MDAKSKIRELSKKGNELKEKAVDLGKGARTTVNKVKGVVEVGVQGASRGVELIAQGAEVAAESMDKASNLLKKVSKSLKKR